MSVNFSHILHVCNTCKLYSLLVLDMLFSRLLQAQTWQWAGTEAHCCSLLGAILAAGDADAQHGGAGVAHDGLDVRKVHVDQARDGDDVGDALHALQEQLKEPVLQAYA